MSKNREKSRVAVDTRGLLGLVDRVGIFFLRVRLFSVLGIELICSE